MFYLSGPGPPSHELRSSVVPQRDRPQASFPGVRWARTKGERRNICGLVYVHAVPVKGVLAPIDQVSVRLVGTSRGGLTRAEGLSPRTESRVK